MTLRLILFAALSCALAGTAAANHLHHGAQVGLFEGNFEFDDDDTEPFVLRLDSDHGMTLLSELEVPERETPGIGHWQRERNSSFSFGYLSYREGSGWLCTQFDDTVPAASCTLVGTGTYSIDPRSGDLAGMITITVKDRADGGDNYTAGPFPMTAKRRSIADLVAIHD